METTIDGIEKEVRNERGWEGGVVGGEIFPSSAGSFSFAGPERLNRATTIQWMRIQNRL
jgi:hypothetical protein